MSTYRINRNYGRERRVRTTKIRNEDHEGAAKYYARWMGEVAARRDHLSRMAKELKQTDGGWGR